MISARRLVPASLLCSALLVAGCSGSSDGGKDGSASSPASPSSATSSAASSAPSSSAAPSSSQPTLDSAKQVYVSIGDSYAAGYQPSGRGKGATTRNGFAYQVVSQAKAKGYQLSLKNFGCAGATTGSAVSQPGCAARALGPGAASYSTPQVTAALDYLRKERGKVGLVTISLGGNDITKCADSTTTTAATSCVSGALGTITANLTSITTKVRAAAGPAARIVGITYPDVFLGEALSSDPDKRNLANLSVLAFQSLINPQLKDAYARGGASFADVTTATGAYTPMTQKTTLQPYGSIPVAVAKVCQLTYFCQYQDIHPRTSGYAIIAKLVTDALPKR